MISHGLNRLYQTNLFGSGWPMSPPRDYPQFESNRDFAVIYDPTQVPLWFTQYKYYNLPINVTIRSRAKSSDWSPYHRNKATAS